MKIRENRASRSSLGLKSENSEEQLRNDRREILVQELQKPKDQ